MLGSHTGGKSSARVSQIPHVFQADVPDVFAEPYLNYVVLAGDLHGLLTVIQGSEDRITSPAKEERPRWCVCPCVCRHRRCVFVLAVPEFELAAHLPVFDLYELVVAGRHAAVLHKPLEIKPG